MSKPVMTRAAATLSAGLGTGLRSRAPRSREWLVIVPIVAVCALLPLIIRGRYEVGVMTLILIYAIAAYGLDLVLGHLGLVSVAHAALLTVGAYTLVILTTKYGVGYWWAAIAGVVVSTLAGLLLAGLTMRSRGHYFSVSSLAFAAVTVVVITQWTSLTNGASGIYGIPTPPGFDSTTALFYLSLIVLTVVLVAMFLLSRSTLGRNLRAIHADEVLAASLGINVVATKLMAFTVSAAIVGLAGPLFASWVSYITPSSAGIMEGFNLLVYVIIGGSATLAGPLVGVALVVGVTEAFRFTELYQTLIFSGIVFLVLLFFRGGVVGSVARVWSRVTARRRPPEADVVPAAEAETDAALLALPHLSPDDRGDPAQPGKVLFEARALTKKFGGVTAVSDVSLVAREGEIIGVIGPNGAGKSTLFGLISGVVGGWSGTATFAGQELNRLAVHERARLGIGRTFQTNRLLADETVLQNLITAGYLHRPTRKSRSADADDGFVDTILDLTGLRAKAGEVVSGLSIEEQKLVGVGMALAVRPRMLLLDEPFAGLRESETPRLMRLLEWLRDQGMVILLVEHKMRVLMSLCSHVYVLDSGQLIAEGSPDQIVNDPRVISAYLGTKNA
ncbi:branched-chain amino acid ABC transporter ATP-binding protein/permease [Spongiactinospora sp. TRM90649]|uniref:branched-chain amino acid ABC transporter ATP-binding protein/permease n=1 Tax=Spongiactinospora sp. TRM90649 TaxID=3031114 RepID=UPI0023F69B22|nr:branched-chain amino acid ABC transporter ATP-binding protein/permease [Spongiactinospora sp. TRM90649]MDF5756311.1 branched-chain amino acid ABC transporter ATP-binding protein/permease [Spongiactinospora sp. TRM90649]